MSTYVPIQAITLSSAAASVNFTGIPQTFTDLVLVANGSTTTSTSNMLFRFNGDTGSNYSRTRVLGNGSSASTERQSNATSMAIGDWGTDRGIIIANVQNYSNTTTNKTVLSRSSSEGFVSAYAGLWRNLNAINSVTFFKASADFTSGTTFTLYGMGSGSPKAFGGDEVRTDGTFWYHTYRSSGIFEPTSSLTVDYLVVAGGGGGASYTGGDASTGGGGAGGFRCTVGVSGGGASAESPLSLNPNDVYTVIIGAGGSAGTNQNGGNGTNSSFASITSLGGGGGGRWGVGDIGQPGGSGGGSSAYTTVNAGGAGTPGQGFKGGDGSPNPSPNNNGGGGGGGAGGAGGNANNSTLAGAGGNGATTSISGTSTTYAGGGGGTVSGQSGSFRGRALGGTGGGGNGQTFALTGSAGTTNTGGGGGAVFETTGGYGGGSGIVIVRYPV